MLSKLLAWSATHADAVMVNPFCSEWVKLLHLFYQENKPVEENLFMIHVDAFKNWNFGGLEICPDLNGKKSLRMCPFNLPLFTTNHLVVGELWMSLEIKGGELTEEPLTLGLYLPLHPESCKLR